MTHPRDTGARPGNGRDFPQRRAGTAHTPLEAIIDGEVVSAHAPYRAEVLAIHDALLRDAQRDFTARSAALLAEDPRRRDTVSPAPWRSTLRILGFLAAATTIAGILIALGVKPRHQPAIDSSTVAVVTGITSLLALCALGTSLLFPSRMGMPNRWASTSLWLATVGSLGSAAALTTRPDTWDSTTPVWWAFTAFAGVILLVLAVLVAFARRHRANAPAPITDADMNALRIEVLGAALERSRAEVIDAWRRLAPDTRAALESTREDSIAELLAQEPKRTDTQWLRSGPPGTVGLPFAADRAHETMHLGAAQLAARESRGQYGHFVTASR